MLGVMVDKFYFIINIHRQLYLLEFYRYRFQILSSLKFGAGNTSNVKPLEK